jgi:plastocyanin domain-containing protein
VYNQSTQVSESMASEMNYKQLRDFLSSGMRLSHIYQPLLIKSLIESGGTATIRQLASIFLSQDESQIRYYENRLKEMPVKVLSTECEEANLCRES